MRLRALFPPLLLAFALLAAAPFTARASVKPMPAPFELFAQAKEVFVGRVTSVGKSTMHVEVLDLLKGSAKGTVEVSPIYETQCCPDRDEDRKPMYASGQRILVAASGTPPHLEFVGNRFGSQDLGDDANVASAVAFAKEMLRIAALPDDVSRRAAMVGHLRSSDPRYVEAVQWFQFSELSEPEQSRPHAAALVAALDAPMPLARKVAARALGGVAAPAAFDRLVEMTTDADSDTASAAAEAVAAYDSDAAVDAVVEASGDSRDGEARLWFLRFLGLSPRPLARQKIHALLAGPHGAARRIAYQALRQRVERFGATQEDEDDLLGVIRRGGIANDNPYDYAPALEATKSVRVAKALIEIVRDPETGSVQRSVAYQVLAAWTTRGQMQAVFDLVRADAALFIERLDRGGKQLQLFWVLGAINTKAALEAVRRAAESHPDEGARADARRTLDSWDYWVTGK